MAIDLGSLGIRQFHFGRVDSAIQPCLTLKAALRASRPNKLHHRLITQERLTSPVGADQRKHAMFDRVPFGSAWREVRYCDRQLEFICKSLQPALPAPTSITIGPAAIGLNQQALRLDIPVLSAHQPPASDGRSGKFGSFMRCTNQHIATIVPQVVNAVGNGFALGLAGKVMLADLQGALSPGSARILEASNQLLLFGVDANDRVAGAGQYNETGDRGGRRACRRSIFDCS
jgi:hypothetical protein